MGNHTSHEHFCADGCFSCSSSSPCVSLKDDDDNDTTNDEQCSTLQPAIIASSSESSSASIASQSRCTLLTSMSPPEILGILTVTNEPKRKRAGIWVDHDRSQSDPLPPSSPHDKRPATRDLIQQHRSDISKFKKAISQHPLYDPVKHDALWLLRFLLTHDGNVAVALRAAQMCLQYRHDWKLDETDLRGNPPSAVCSVTADYFQSFDPDALVFSHPDQKTRGVIQYIHLAGVHQIAWNSPHTASAEPPVWYFFEWMFQSLDSVTRRTGRLTKSIRLLDLENYFTLNLLTTETPPFLSSHVNGLAEDTAPKTCHYCCYPLMFGDVFVVNAPFMMNTVFGMMKPLLPKRLVESWVVLPKNKLIERLLEYMSLDDIPVKYGGTNASWPPLRRVGSKDWEATIELVKESSRLVEL